LTVKVVNGLLETITGLRNERLLIRYYDARNDLHRRLVLEAEGDDGPLEVGDA
jgi:hypothetical protein